MPGRLAEWLLCPACSGEEVTWSKVGRSGIQVKCLSPTCGRSNAFLLDEGALR